jgi:hypothetical protein
MIVDLKKELRKKMMILEIVLMKISEEKKMKDYIKAQGVIDKKKY